MSSPRPCWAWPSSACKPTPAIPPCALTLSRKPLTVPPTSPTPTPSQASAGSAASASAPLAPLEKPPPLPNAAESSRSMPGSASSAAAIVFGSAERDRLDERRELRRPAACGAERLAQEAGDVDVEERRALRAHLRARVLQHAGLRQRRALRRVDRRLHRVLAAEDDEAVDDAGGLAATRVEAVVDAAVRAWGGVRRQAREGVARGRVVARGGHDDLVAAPAERQRGCPDAVA